MVTKVGGRGQVGIRGTSVTDEWEQLVKFAAGKNGQTFADFVVDTTRAAALAIVKHKRDTPDDTAATADVGSDPAVSSTLPVRIEDVAAGLQEQLATLANMGTEQQDRLDRIERQGRRGRWRR